MPKSSRHKSHRQSKHSSKDVREYSESDEDVKTRELNKEEGSVRVSRTLGSSEKRKDPPAHSNGGLVEEYVGSKRRRDKEREKEREKEKEKGGGSAVSDRWIAGGAVEVELKGGSSRVDGEKTLKSKSGGDSKSKSSRAHDSVGEKKEEGKGASKVDSKRRYEKESSRKEAHLGKDFIESKDKVIVLEKEKDKEKIKMLEKEKDKEKIKMFEKEKDKEKIKMLEKDKDKDKEKIKMVEKEKERERKVSVHEVEDEVVDIGDAILPAVVFGEEKGGKHGREINVWPVLDERVLESEKETEKRRSKRESTHEKVKYEDLVKGSEDKHVSSRGERAKDGKYKDEKYKVGSHGEKHREDLDREAKHKDEQKYKDGTHGDKHREDFDREAKYKDEKYKDGTHGDKYREDFDRDTRYKDEQKYKDGNHGDKYREEVDRDAKYKDEQKYKDGTHGDKHREEIDRDAKYKDEQKYKDGNHGDKHHEEFDRDARYNNEQKYKDGTHGDKHLEDFVREARYKDEQKYKDGSYVDKYREDFDREARYKDEQKYKDGSHGVGDKHREDIDREARYKDEQKYKDGSHGGKHRDDIDREARYKDEQKYKDGSHGVGDKHREDFERDARYKDEQKYKDGSHGVGDKPREDFERDARYKDEKYAEDVDRERRYRDAKYRESSDKVNRHKDDKYREDVNRDKRPRDDKYREGGDRDFKYRDAKYREDAEKDYRRRVDKYHEDGNREDRQKDDWYIEDYSRDSRIREEKNWEDAGRETRRREEKQRDDIVKDKRLRDTKYQDERFLRDGTNDNSDPKRSRDESEVAEFHHKRLTNHDGSPNFDDRSTRYKDDRGKRRAGDKEEYNDIIPRSIKEHHLDIEKNSTTARIESVGYRGRSSLRDADNMVISPNHVRRGDSPSYRLIKQEESRFRENPHGGRERRDVTPGKEYAGISGVTDKVFRLNEKSLPKDDRQSDDASIEKRPKEDPLISSFQMVDRSPSSASNDRRNVRRADVRRSLDGEDSGQRSGGSKESKDYYGRDNRGNRELPIDNLPRDETFQPETENLSVASSFPKTSHFSNNNNNRSHLPPTPFRGGPDRPFDDDNRNKLNRRRRMDPNMGRSQGNAWRGVPNWPSPVPNGFVPFQHGPPPLGFHPVMPQFPTPPMFNVRPSMEPFHLHDGDRFPGHGRPLGWDANNPMFGDDPHMYGRLDWDHSRGLNSGRGWETGRDFWKGPNTGVSAELSAVPQKDDSSAQGDDKNQPSVEIESVEIGHPSDVVEMDTAEATKAIEDDMCDSKIRDDAYLSNAYLSMLDISEDLSQCELYSQYTSLVGIGLNANPEDDDFKLVIMEEDIDALGKDSEGTSNASLFCTMNDSIFQRAMSMYKKLKEEVMALGQDKVPSPAAENMGSALPSNPIEEASNDEQSSMEVIPTLHQKEAEIAVSDFKKVKMEASFGFTCDEIAKPFPTDSGVKCEPIATLKEVKMEIADNIVEDTSVSAKKAVMDSTNDNGSESHNLKDGNFVHVPFSGASAEVGSEGVIESGLVNLSRIHLSPESTH